MHMAADSKLWWNTLYQRTPLLAVRSCGDNDREFTAIVQDRYDCLSLRKNSRLCSELVQKDQVSSTVEDLFVLGDEHFPEVVAAY
jgi:hypothetical protein